MNRKKTRALLIGGGSVASVFTAGMLAELDDRGLIENFDYIIGCSSGSFSACFVASGAIQKGAEGYWRMLPSFVQDKRYINPWRLLAGQSVMNTRYLVDPGLTSDDLNPIPWQDVIDSDWNKEGRLLIQVMDADTGEPFFCSNFTTIESLRDAVAASCAIPFVAAIRPFRMKQESFDQMLTRDRGGNFFDKQTVRCWDGETSDMNFRSAMSWLLVDSYCILTTTKKDFSNKCYPFGKKFWLPELLLGWLMFAPYWKAIYHYQRERIWEEAHKQFKVLSDLSKNNPSRCQLMTIPEDVDFVFNHTKEPEKMKMYLSIGKEVAQQWIKYLN